MNSTGMLLLLCASALLVLSVVGRQAQSVQVTGILNCDGKPAKDVKIKLFDKDTFTFDDKMGETKTDASGYFNIHGTAHEMTSIQPKLNVYHRCKYTPLLPTCYQKFSIRIPKDYITKGERAAKTFNMGNINLAAKMSGQSTDCLN